LEVNQFKKILIIRFSSIGDIVLTTPIIRCIKLQTGAEVHFLTKPGFQDLLKPNPYIDKFHILHDTVSATAPKLKDENYDLVIDLQKNIKSRYLCVLLGAKMITFDKLNIAKWIEVNLKMSVLPKGKHLVDRYFDSLRKINISNDGEGLDFFISTEDRMETLKLTNGLQYNVLVLGANYYTKRIPLSKCEEIIHNATSTIVLLGGKDVLEIAEALKSKFPSKVINQCGQLSLGKSAAYINYADAVISGDTGLMHIAAALKKKMYVIWGNTIPDFGMYAYYGQKSEVKSINLEVKNLSCRPCSKLGYDRCPKGHLKCMMENDVSVIQI